MEKPKTIRIEALTDGVFAIVLTLLVLELSIPVISETTRSHNITQSLLEMWHTYASYGMSFLILGLFWLHHSGLYNDIKHSDGRLAILNLLFLMIVSLIPFTSTLVSHYWDEPISAILYGLNWLIPLNINLAMYSYAHKNKLMNERVDARFIKGEKISGLFISLCILLAMWLSFVSTLISFILYSALALLFVITSFIGIEGLQLKRIK